MSVDSRIVLLVAALLVGCGGDASPAAPSAATATPAPRPRALPALCQAKARVVGRIADPELDELSGLTFGDPDTLYGHEDSGAGPDLLALRPDGTVLGRSTVAGAEAVDWEDIAAARGNLFIADTGDNAKTRPAVQIYRLPVADLASPAERIDLTYPDGPQSAEALLADPLRRQLVLVTKELLSARVYSHAPASGTLRRGPRIGIGPVTAGSVSADGHTVALRTYAKLYVWRRTGREPLTKTLGRRPTCTAKADLSVEPQGEALALTRHGRAAYTSTEGPQPKLRRIG